MDFTCNVWEKTQTSNGSLIELILIILYYINDPGSGIVASYRLSTQMFDYHLEKWRKF